VEFAPDHSSLLHFPGLQFEHLVQRDVAALRAKHWYRDDIVAADNDQVASNGIIWKHSYEILLPVWVRLVLDSSECNGIPIEKERQVLRISEEKCCTETGSR
jgi:hypothetical protein